MRKMRSLHEVTKVPTEGDSVDETPARGMPLEPAQIF